MCIFGTPKMKTIDAPKRENVVNSDQDAAAAAAENEKKRNGFLSTIATSGTGLMDAANIKKVHTGV